MLGNLHRLPSDCKNIGLLGAGKGAVHLYTRFIVLKNVSRDSTDAIAAVPLGVIKGVGRTVLPPCPLIFPADNHTKNLSLQVPANTNNGAGDELSTMLSWRWA